MRKTQFFKILLKNHSIGSKYQLKTLLNTIGLAISMLGQIIVFEIENCHQTFKFQQSIFPFLPILSAILGLGFFGLVVLGFMVNRKQINSKDEHFRKNALSKISLIISFLSQIFYIPSIAATFNIIRNSNSDFSTSKISIATLLTVVIPLSQSIITIVQNLSVFSIKAKSFGKNILTNPLLICWIFNLMFPFVYQIKWLLFGFTLIFLTIIGCLLYRNPRLCPQFDKWLKIYISAFISVQIFILVQSFQSNSLFDINLVLLAITLCFAIYFLLQRRLLSFIDNFGASEHKIAMAQLYYNVINHNHENLTLILLSHQKNCNLFTECKCRTILFNPENSPQSTQRQISPQQNHINHNCLNFVIQFYENYFCKQWANETSKKKIEFDQKSSELLLFCYMLVVERKLFTKAFLLLKQYRKQWEGISLFFQVQTDLMIEEITELKNIELIKSRKKSTLYGDYWTFHSNHQTFVRYIEQILPLVQQIWEQMLSIQPNESKLLSDMKRFDYLDRRIFSTYQNLLKNSSQQIRHINQIMSRYEKVVLNIFNQKLSIVKSSNILLEKQLNKLQGENQVLDKEGRIFAKSLNNIVFLVNIDQADEKNSPQSIKLKNKNFRQVMEQTGPINSLREILLPQITENHDKAFDEFLQRQAGVLNHQNTVVLIRDQNGKNEIQEYEIWCQMVAFGSQISVSVILSKQGVVDSSGVFIKNEQDQIVYESGNLKQLLMINNSFNTYRSPEEDQFGNDKEDQKFHLNDVHNYAQKITELNNGKLTFYRVKVPGLGQIDTFNMDSYTMGFNSIRKGSLRQNSNNQQDTKSQNKSPIMDQIMSTIQHPKFNQKIMNLEKFYNQVHSPQSKNVFKKVTIFLVVIFCLFLILWIACYMTNIEKSVTLHYLSSKVNVMSELINSLCEANTALKLLVIKSYFDKSFSGHREGIQTIEYYQKKIRENMDLIANQDIMIEIYHLNVDGSSFYTTQNAVNSVVSGFLKQVTYITSQPVESLSFSPILSQNPIPLPVIVKDFFQANSNIVNRIFVTLFFRRSTFFQQKISKTLTNFSSNNIFPISITGFSLMMVISIILICYRKKQQEMKNESLKILQKISLDHKSHRLAKVKQFKDSYLPYQEQKFFNKQSSKKSIYSKLNQKQQLDVNSFNLFSEIFKAENAAKSNKRVDLGNQVPFFTKIAEIGRLQVFHGSKWSQFYLRKVGFFIPFIIYFAHLGLQNLMFNVVIQNKLNLQNQLAWQGQFIAGSRQYSIELGMFENPFDLGKSNVQTVDDIYVKMHQIKKLYSELDEDSHFSRAREEFESGNICEKLERFKKSLTVGVKLTKEECENERFGGSLENGFHQALVYYLDSVRHFSQENSNPYYFNLSRRIQLLTSKNLQTIVYLGEYLHQVHKIMYDAYQEDVKETISGFIMINDIVGALVLVLWVVLSILKWKLIVKQKQQQISIVKASFKLISFSLLSKDDPLIQKVTKGNINFFFK